MTQSVMKIDGSDGSFHIVLTIQDIRRKLRIAEEIQAEIRILPSNPPNNNATMVDVGGGHVMTGREYLKRLLDYQDEVDRVEDRMLRMRDSNLVSYATDMPRAASRDNQAQEKRMVAYAEYDEQLQGMKRELKDMKQDATKILALLSKASYEQVLYYRYIDMFPWSVVAEKMDDKTVDNAYRLHREALKELDAILAKAPDLVS